MQFSSTLILASVLALATAVPCPSNTSAAVVAPTKAPAPPKAPAPKPAAPAGPAITADLIKKIAPTTATCKANSPECADATRAAAALNIAFTDYKIESPGARAALIALTMFESANYTYNQNHFPAPGRPGQGTKNMQMYEFNLEYARSLFPPAVVDAAAAQGPNAVLHLVQGDKESFGSAAWYLTAKCDASVETALADAKKPSWDAYLTKCVGTTAAPERDVVWNAVKAAMGI